MFKTWNTLNVFLCVVVFLLFKCKQNIYVVIIHLVFSMSVLKIINWKVNIIIICNIIIIIIISMILLEPETVTIRGFETSGNKCQTLDNNPKTINNY